MLVFVALWCFAVADAATGTPLQPHALAPSFTYNFEIDEPTAQPSTRTAVPGRTALTIIYSEPKVSRHMGVTSGPIHDVINTWQALKVGAVMHQPYDAASCNICCYAQLCLTTCRTNLLATGQEALHTRCLSAFASAAC